MFENSRQFGNSGLVAELMLQSGRLRDVSEENVKKMWRNSMFQMFLIRLNLIRIAGEFLPKLPEVLAVLPFVAWPDWTSKNPLA